MRSCLFRVLLLAALSPACASAPEAEESDDALVGGSREAGWLAAGYLASSDAPSRVVCGATLIAPKVVVTAAHCVHRHRTAPLVFGVGSVRERRHVAVRSIHYHAEAHPEGEGAVDVAHTLRLNDLAYLQLARPVTDVAPAAIPTASPKWAGCDVHLVAYGGRAEGESARVSATGCVVLKPEIAGDAILEIRPRGGAAVCHVDGDEGHAAMARDEAGREALVGVYVGSVTQSMSDCRAHLQLLNGYEDVAGHADFFAEALASGR